MSARRSHSFCLPILFTVLFACGEGFSQNYPPEKVDDFFADHCYSCHDDTTSKGGLNLYDLAFELGNHANFETWERVFHRVELGEMPPAKKPRPEAKQKKDFLDLLHKPMLAADLKEKRELGSVRVRRLTRLEYENTLHDLLGIDLPLQEILPEDPATHGFETVAEGQQLSHHNLASYLAAADVALEEAFGRVSPEGESRYKNLISATKLASKINSGNYRGPQLSNGYSIAWYISPQFYGRMAATRVPESGWYRVTLKQTHGINAKDGVVWGTLRSGACSSNAPILYPVGIIEATSQKRDISFEAWIREGHMLELKPNDSTLKRAPTGSYGGNVSYKGQNHQKAGLKGIAVKAIEMERIYPNAARWELRSKLFAGISKEELPKLQQNQGRKQLVTRAIRNFADRAFRRPVTEAQVALYADLALHVMDEPGKKPIDGLKVAYRAVLCSPRFLTLVEKPGHLDDHAIASRLSYTLWNSMPDEKLRAAADAGKLKEDWKTYHSHVTRMVDSEKSDRFVQSFTDQWLNLKEIDFTTPDTRRFRTFDSVVKESMVEETRAFVRELVRKNLPITHLIDSDFAMWNERLARFYGVKDVPLKIGQGVQRVSLNNHLRGGLVTQGSVLKVTANGTTTSPVIRGVWVGERILGLEIPPPPDDVPAVEPDIRGAVSIRDQLSKHTNSESCAGCHRNIDPAGFALENFDAVGLWRQKYGTQKKAAVVDPSGITPEGTEFASLKEWKEIYVNRPDQLTEAFAKQLLTYATGASPRFSDRAAIDQIVKRAKEKNYGVRSIIHTTLGSEVFRTK
ncbi:MAG: DUF1592 domain-containing protein [Verrucomicrobiota bacterium]